ncbi:hypothetical protein M441DRAFT_275602 [Trichoderma asperellum CBS 433.97]|uniref:Uncharacterized protein n=1 Tax=Trichoderma asperellum (strain ATCC 204424 / CBS 433.97 / NBRC 101777) TaxID=1042311 RepID=A0A2T3YUT4_TRIA4|nr:hypothetical protein M441DRAFT_275602 [Trichoderma asperellum CBS 433.97]PTB36318.1 hypothetical protein M441DRAFT_275602 [Trichoderma asperellum CBS 433.97]
MVCPGGHAAEGRWEGGILASSPRRRGSSGHKPPEQAPSSQIPGQGTSKDFALCIDRSISILVCRLRCISATFRPLPLNPCTRRGLHRPLCSVYNSKHFLGIRSWPYPSTAPKYSGRQATTALCFKDARYKCPGPAYQQRPHRPFACQPATIADALSDDMLSRASRHRQE